MEAATGERTAFILLTDIHRSTQLWERFPREFGQSLEQHNALVEATVLAHGGEIMKNLGDGYIAIFNTPDECVRSGVEVQRQLKGLPPLPDGSEILVRVVGHGGQLQLLATGGGYFGRPLNRASRICQVCHPGQTLVSDEVAESLRGLPENVQLFNLGRHHLRDLAEPEVLYQVDHPEFALHQFPPLPTLEYRPNNLVYQPNAFIGRNREMAELKALLLGKRHRLITLTAPGGYGKSRLATQLCANMLEHYANGVFEVLLAPVGSHERIVSTTADALGFQFYGRGEPQQQLIDYLRAKEMLLAFDNFEHVMAGKKLLAEILQHAPDVSILVTSREPLRLKAEKVYRLEPLPVGVGWGFIPAEKETARLKPRPTEEDEEPLPDAVQLFVDRAALVKHDFALTAENLSLVNEVCAKLDGVPLAVELAAAWADSFTLSELLAELEHQLELTSRMSDVEPRHRSIRASLDWSYNLLSEEQREVIRAVSTFKGGFFLEAAEAVVGRAPAGGGVPAESGEAARARHAVPLRKILAELGDKGWLFTREVLGQTRFFLRDAASHRYAFEKLRESAEYESAVLAHAQYFAALIEREGERLKGHGQTEALKVLAAELENISEALDTALRRGNGELILPFARRLWRYLETAALYREWQEWYERMRDKALELDETSVEAHCQLGCSGMLRRTGKYREAEESAARARASGEEMGDKHIIAHSLNNLGLAAYRQGRHEEAEKLYHESLQIWRETGDRLGTANALNNLGLVAYSTGRYDEAERLHRQSLEIRREIGDRSGIATSLNNLGTVALSTGRYDEAERLHRQSLEIRREIGDRSGIAMSLGSLGSLAYLTGRFDEAEKLFQESLEIRREIGDRSGIALSLGDLGCLAYLAGRFDEAEKLFQESLEIRREIGDRPGIALSLNNLGAAQARRGQWGKARECLSEGIGTAGEIGSPMDTICGACVSGYLLARVGSPADAAIVLAAAAHQAQEINYKLEPMEQSELDEGTAKLKETLPEEELADIKARAEKMSLDELTEFALRALAELELELER